MALKDLIRSIHGPDTLGPSLDLHLMKQEPDYRAPGWHPSDFCGMCPRERVLRKLVNFPDDGRGIDARTQRIFDIGTAIHGIYQEYFTDMGILWGRWKSSSGKHTRWGLPHEADNTWLYAEVPVKKKLGLVDSDMDVIVGRADGIIQLAGQWFLLEIKSINDRGFHALREPMEKHTKQARIYAELINTGHVDTRTDSCDMIPKLSGIIMLYVNKNLSLEKEYRLDLDPKASQEQLNLPVAYLEAFKSKSLPPRCAACTNLLRPPAKQCAVGSYCFGTMSWSELEATGGSFNG